MKFIAVILALSVISGCHGRFLFQDEPKSNWENLVNQFWERVSELSSKAEDMNKNIKSSQLGRELDTLISDSMAELQMYTDDVQSKLAPYALDTAQRAHEDLQLLANKLHTHMVEAKERMTDYSQEFQVMVSQNSEEIRNKANMYNRKLKKRLNKDIQDIRTKMETFFEEVQARAAQRVDDMRERLTSYFEVVHQNAEGKFSTIKDLMNIQSENMKEKLKTLRDQVVKTKENVFASFHDKVEELQNWFEQHMNYIKKTLN